MSLDLRDEMYERFMLVAQGQDEQNAQLARIEAQLSTLIEMMEAQQEVFAHLAEYVERMQTGGIMGLLKGGA